MDGDQNFPQKMIGAKRAAWERFQSVVRMRLPISRTWLPKQDGKRDTDSREERQYRQARYGYSWRNRTPDRHGD